MTFNSWEFLLFYPIVLALYFILPHKVRHIMLLIASYFFYMCYSPELVFLIFGTTIISWLSAKMMERTERVGVRRLLLAITLTVCLGVLFFYKYFDFLSASVYDILLGFGVKGEPLYLNLALPVGISFYTFQTLSYVIDVYRGNIKTEGNFLFYALFVSFFPQLVAGPIERPENLIPQLKEKHSPSRDNAVAGAKLMLLGFFKKVCVADLVSGAVDGVYNSPSEAGALAVVIATVLFSLQIYCDFSGYTDIAIGCARIMGIKLMKNFDHPYLATGIKEFWARWHISLSSWFRDYLYIPLGGNRRGRARTLLNLFIVFLVSGLWHGADWTFVIWGALHGIYQVVGNLTAAPRVKLLQKFGKDNNSPAVVAVRRILTFILVAFAWIFFRANSVGELLVLLRALFTFSSGTASAAELMGLDFIDALLIVTSVIALFIMDNLVKYDGTEGTLPERTDGSRHLVGRGSFIYTVWCILIVWALLLSRDMISSFIYFQF